jgi:hypothetical protein
VDPMEVCACGSPGPDRMADVEDPSEDVEEVAFAIVGGCGRGGLVMHEDVRNWAMGHWSELKAKVFFPSSRRRWCYTHAPPATRFTCTELQPPAAASKVREIKKSQFSSSLLHHVKGFIYGHRYRQSYGPESIKSYYTIYMFIGNRIPN